MWFDLDTFVLDAAQALCVALPAAGIPAFLLRLAGRGWALVAPLSVVVSVVAIGAATASADVLTWIALLLVPPGCALALGWAAHGVLKAGVVAMAVIDAVFIFGDLWGEQNAAFNAAVPAAGLPRLQVADIGDVSTDYGDYFVAGLVGAILAAERRPQAVAAVATLVAAQAWNQLFLVVDSLPGTVPPTVVLLAFEAWNRRRERRPPRVPRWSIPP